MDIKVNTPPQFTDVRSVYQYLYQMAETINAANSAMQNVTDESISRAIAASGTASKKESDQQADTLRALIMNTAQTINVSMGLLQTNLETQIQAVSNEFGTVDEKIDTKITASAGDILASFAKSSLITGMQKNVDNVTAYKQLTEGYIRAGFIEDIDNRPVVGIAIGQVESVGQELVDGVLMDRLNGRTNCAFYTAGKVSFRVDGAEVAYFSSQGLHCGDLDVGGTVTLGGKWQISTGGNLTIRWVGA